jgi:(2Fe-2S) ferredoxin
VHAALEDAVRPLDGAAAVKAVGCAGLCHREPLVEVLDGEKRALYGNVAPADVRKLVRRHVRPRGLAPRVHAAVGDLYARLTDDNEWVEVASLAVEASPYTAKQVRIVLENCGEVEPLSLDDYRAREGFRALQAVLRGRRVAHREIRASACAAAAAQVPGGGQVGHRAARAESQVRDRQGARIGRYGSRRARG